MHTQPPGQTFEFLHLTLYGRLRNLAFSGSELPFCHHACCTTTHTMNMPKVAVHTHVSVDVHSRQHLSVRMLMYAAAGCLCACPTE